MPVHLILQPGLLLLKPSPGCPGRGVQTLVSPGYVGESGVRRGVRGTKGCPGYEGASGVRRGVRGTKGCPGYEGVSGVRWCVRGTKGCPEFDTLSHAYFSFPQYPDQTTIDLYPGP